MRATTLAASISRFTAPLVCFRRSIPITCPRGAPFNRTVASRAPLPRFQQPPLSICPPSARAPSCIRLTLAAILLALHLAQ